MHAVIIFQTRTVSVLSQTYETPYASIPA